MSAARSLVVVLDATSIPPNRGGVGLYLSGLISALPKVLAQDESVVVFVKPEDSDIVPGAIAAGNRGAQGLRARTAWLPSRAARLAWEQAVLPGRVAREGAQVLHCPHYTVPLVCAAKRVVTFHDATFFTHPRYHERAKVEFFRRAMRQAARRAERIIMVSQTTADDLVPILGLDPGRVRVVPHGVDHARFRPLALGALPGTPTSGASSGVLPSEAKCDVALSGAPSDVRPPGGFADPAAVWGALARHGVEGPYLLFLGTLEPRKNIPRLIEAFDHAVTRESLPHTLVLAGAPGWDREALDTALAGAKAPVRRLGYVDEADKPLLLAGASAMAYPSLYEGFGMPVIEAMACGAPVVTSNVGATAEVAGQAAVLVDPEDVEGMADALAGVLADPAAAQRLRRSGLERASAFTWEATARLTLDVYREAAACSAASA